MFAHLMVPVDPGNLDRLERALACAGELARHYGAAVTFVGVTAATPGRIAHTPAEHAARLDACAAEQAARARDRD